MGQLMRLTAADDHVFDTYRAVPTVVSKGGVAILQEAFGVNKHIQTVCDEYAAQGFVAMAPAIYDRQQRNAVFGYDEASMEQARRLRRGLDYGQVLLDLDAVLKALRPEGRVGVVGYCVGGSAAWLAACRLKIDAASCYYPSDLRTQYREQPKCPIIMHFADKDRFVPQDVVAAFHQTHPDVPAFLYQGDHGFNCSDRVHNYNAEIARLAFERTIALFTKHLISR